MIRETRRSVPPFFRSSLSGLLLLVGYLIVPGTVSAEIELQQQEPITVGVIDLQVNNVDEGEARAISERLRTWLGRTGVFQVIERNQMDDIMEELGFQYSGACNTDECIVQVGQMLGATKMIAGSISLVGTLYSLQIRIVDMQTGRIEHTSFRDEPGGMEAVLRGATQFVANELAEFVSGTAVEPAVDPGQPVAPTTAQITFQSTPPGAAIIIDTRATGRITPATLPLTAGAHDLILRLPDHNEHSESFQVTGGLDRMVSASLTEIDRGSAQLAIQSSLLGAKLRISGDLTQAAVLNNPRELVTLRPGHYLLTVRAPGYAAWSREIDLADGDNSTVPVTLTPKSRFTAGLLAILPGVGHFYANRPGRGILALAGTIGAVVYGAGQFGAYTEKKDAYDELVALYRAADTYPELVTLKAAVEAKYVEVMDSRDQLGTVIGIMGGVWLLNIIDASLLMPRLRNAGSALPAPDIKLGTRSGRLTLSLRVNF